MSDKKYALRQRQRNTPATLKLNSYLRKELLTTTTTTTKAKLKSKAAPLSKYRRKTANARERSRMREINSAFETLRKCVPQNPNAAPIIEDESPAGEKLTKITTLRLAMNYIESLAEQLLLTNPSLPDKTYHHQDKKSPNTNNNARKKSNKKSHHQQSDKAIKFTNSQQKRKELTTILTTNEQLSCYKTLGLESDGESLNFSDPCLSPLHYNTNQFMGKMLDDSSFEFGLTDLDASYQEIKKPFYSPLDDDELTPYNNSYSDLFAEAPFELFLA